MGQNSAYPFSIVIPTYQRRDVVLASVRALEKQEVQEAFEVIVVVDGSNDGTEKTLRALPTSFPLTVIKQPNQGASAARNKGVEQAKGERILFLDDDMTAHPRLLAEHNRSHSEGADVVIGHLPLHPDSPQNFLSDAVKQWAEERVNELLSVNGNLPFREIMTGQLSISRKTFFEVGGFDTKFTRHGSFGNEDLDFGLRLQQKGYAIVFNPNAISWQKYVVTPRQLIRRYRQLGRADVMFARLHPELIPHFFTRPYSSMDRYFWRWWRWLIRWLMMTAFDLGIQRLAATGLFGWLVNLEYYEGVREAGGIPRPRPLRILCYHAISNLAGAPVLEQYGLPPEQFRKQLHTLERWGFQFIDADEFFRFLQGDAGLPRRAVMLTFDDCYQDLLEAALPILEEKSVPAIAFAVSRRVGKTNDWDKAIGAPELRLLDEKGLRKLARCRLEIGTHSRSHPMLNQIAPEQLQNEISGSVADLEALGLKRPSMLAYPYGEYNEQVQKATQQAGLRAAFTVEPGLAKPDVNPYQIPRIEILRKDTGWRFLWKVLRAN